jgi:hypothetical protein
MAQTTTSVNACDVTIEVDNAAGSLVDISGSSNQCSISISSNTGQTFTFDGDWALQKICKKSASISVQAVYSTADAEAANVLLDWWFGSAYNSARSVEINIPDQTTGSDTYTGEFVLSSASIPLSAEDAAPILVSFELLNDGEFTRAANIS